MNARPVMVRLGVLAIAALLPLGGRAAFAQTLGVSGDPGLLRISVAVSGSEPISVSNASTTYTVTTPNVNVRFSITAQLNASMPLGVTLTATLDGPPGSTSLGPIALDPTAREVLSGIRRRANSTHAITYDLTATVQAGVVPVSTRIVTLTIVQAP